ncbi:MAG TPA: hypothetical protein DCZ94_17220 [Lentisphaeria bacterium]|nr:MAG: hypothetical protein A2X48_20960 [Lentisphaerae bacterium GWF2_49_21]HBC88686.1 hypothetical protein [Lentisphaeria bacterium]
MFKGSVVASVTPYNRNGSIDRNAVKNLVSFFVEQGMDGIFCIGSTGEFFFLGPEQRRQIITAAASAIKGKAKLFAGVSDLGPMSVKERLKEAAGSGADIGVLTAPLGMALEQSQLVDYIRHIADDSPIPVAVYHHPRYPTSFDMESLKAIFKHGNIAAIKDSEDDRKRLDKILSLARGTKTSVLTGKEMFIRHCLMNGGQGSVTSLGNIVPSWMASIQRECEKGDTKKALQWQKKLDALFHDIFESKLQLPTLARFTWMLKIFLSEKGICSMYAFDGALPDQKFIRQVKEIYRKHLVL